MIPKNTLITFEEIYKTEGVRSAMLFLERQGAKKEEIISLCEQYNEKNSNNKSSGDSFSPDVICECGSIESDCLKKYPSMKKHQETMGCVFNCCSGTDCEIPLSNSSYSKSVSSPKKKSFIKRLFGFK